MLLHSPFARPLNPWTFGSIPNFQNAPKLICPCLVFRRVLGRMEKVVKWRRAVTKRAYMATGAKVENSFLPSAIYLIPLGGQDVAMVGCATRRRTSTRLLKNKEVWCFVVQQASEVCDWWFVAVLIFESVLHNPLEHFLQINLSTIRHKQYIPFFQLFLFARNIQ